MRFVVEQERFFDRFQDGLWMTLLGVFVLVAAGVLLCLRQWKGEIRGSLQLMLSFTVGLVAVGLIAVPSMSHPQFAVSQVSEFQKSVRTVYGVDLSQNQALSLLNVSNAR